MFKKKKAASPLVHSSDKYQSSQVANGSHSQSANNRTISAPIIHQQQQQHTFHPNYVDIDEQDEEVNTVVLNSHNHLRRNPYEQRATEPPFLMTGNGFFSNNSSGPLMKSKSGSLPGRYSTRGFRDTFISSMNPPTAVSANSSPQHQHLSTTPNQNMSEMSPTPPTRHHTPPTTTKDNKDSKKWTFGGLFKRKVKSSTNSHQMSPRPNVIGNPSPATVSISSSSPAPSSAMGNHNAVSLTPQHGMSRTKYLASRKQKMSESDFSSFDSENETENNYSASANKLRQNNQIQQQPQPQQQQQTPQPQLSFKQNFLTRRLSKRKEKAAKKANAAAHHSPYNGFLQVPSNQLQNGRRVGSSPDSLNNGGGGGTNGPWQSWETTKKPVANNYSSSGSLSLSMEGSSKGSRITAKEAVKARAIARRESYFRESSSSDGETGDTEERSRSSLQGSHSSLSSRNRRQRGLALNQQASRRPELIQGSPSSPIVNYEHSTANNAPKILPPGSPRWEARIIYQQETLVESDGPVTVKLPKNRSDHNQTPTVNYQHPQNSHVLVSTSTNSDDQAGQVQVIKAGLRVPIVQNPQTANPNTYMTEEVTYANLPHGVNTNRSGTPYNNNNNNNYYSVSPSPPPPPPRRDFSRTVNQNQQQQQHPNFYRPVSCSYLDSYQYHQQQQHNSIGPTMNGHVTNRGSSYYNNNSGGDFEINGVTNGYFEHEIEIQQQQQQAAAEYSQRNNNFLAQPKPYNGHHVGRSPSEPPEIKVQFARDTPLNRMASPSPYNNNTNGGAWNNGTEMNGNNSGNGKYQQQQNQPVIMSKLGFPVRRLHEVNKLPPTQSPVHMRASEFWRRKEQELGPVLNNSSSTTTAATPSQKRFLSRVRSADSSPLPVPRMRNSPATMLNSNESISSLSSFSAEQAPSPNNLFCSTPKSSKIQSGPLRPQTLTLKTPGFQISTPQSSKDKENSSSTSKEKAAAAAVQQQSACERLKVRLPNGQSPTATPVPPPAAQQQPQQQPVKEPATATNTKSPGRNLEDALNELEDMYKSLRLSDEDLLDRAERRDLPTAHQELRNAPMLPQLFHFSSPPGSVESLATGSSGSNTNHPSAYSFHSTENLNRVRAPPLRRSSRPDTVADDMAKRRFDHPEHPPNDPRTVVSKTGSYMILSPAFSPPSSPCPPTTHSTASVSSLLGLEDPDLTLDDVTFRNFKRANSIRIIEPQPPFGIPLGPVAAAPDSDYLHSKPVEKFRPIFRHTKRPDIIKDDIAFRNLRKDLNQENNLSKDWTPRLFSPTRENFFDYNIKPEQRSKKLRAIRSLSANISHLIPFKESAVNSEIGKWNSFTDLHCEGSSSTGGRVPVGINGERATGAFSYLQPSWVEQIEKVQTSTETLTDYRNVNGNNCKFTAAGGGGGAGVAKVVSAMPAHDPNKPRRPWTDILLESFEREKQAELERIAAEIAADAEQAEKKAVAHQQQQKNTIELRTQLQQQQENCAEEDDDVFEDAREEAKSTSPDDPVKTRYATPEIATTTIFPSAFALLAGQKHRRGSWVEPTKSSSLYNSFGHEMLPEDRRRRSWSDVPKELGSALMFEGLQSSPTSPTKRSTLFNPLPPPRKIKQINLNAFSTTNAKTQPVLKETANEREEETESEIDTLFTSDNNKQQQQPCNDVEMTTTTIPSISRGVDNSGVTDSSESLSSDNLTKEGKFKRKTSKGLRTKKLTTNRVLSPKSPTKGEDELNELMDALLREADTCGPPTSRRIRRSPSSKVKPQDSKVILEEELFCSSSMENIGLLSDSAAAVGCELVTMPKGNRIPPLPKIPSIEESAVTSNSSAPNNRTSENIDNNIPLLGGKVPKTDSIEDLIDSINESLPELEASCFKNNKQLNSSSSNRNAECYIVPSSTTTSRIPPPPALHHHHHHVPVSSSSSLTDNTHERKEEQQQSQNNKNSPPHQKIESQEKEKAIADENENLAVMSRHRKISDPSLKLIQQQDSAVSAAGADAPPPQTTTAKNSKFSGGHVEDELDIIDDDFQGRDNKRGSFMNSPSSSSKVAPSGPSLTKSEGLFCETNERHQGSTSEKMQIPKENDGTSSLKESGRRPVAPTFIKTPTKELLQQNTINTGNSRLSESPSEISNKIYPPMRIATSRSRSHSVISSISTSPTNTSENGENKKEKDKSYRRKSHLNRAFTEEPVPDVNYSIDVDNNGRKRSQEGSSRESSMVDDVQKLQKSIQKAPNIPSIFSKSEKQSPSPLSTTSSRKASPKPTASKPAAASISNKVQTFEQTRGSPVVKRDSFSDAEGVSFIKKLLQKESLQEKTGDKPTGHGIKIPGLGNKDSSFCLKKSPSAGSNSYWSRFSNSQPAFLKRFFDKPEKTTAAKNNLAVGGGRKLVAESSPATPSILNNPPKEPESISSFSVAQKASFFMKLEHEQRFSKWRKNSDAEIDVSSSAAAAAGNVRPKSRHLTQPVTPTEVEIASQYFMEATKAEMKQEVPVDEMFANLVCSELSSIAQKENEKSISSLDIPCGNSSSYNECDDSFPAPETQFDLVDPSHLSIKDRVHMFDKIITTSTKTPASSAPTPCPPPPTKIFGNCPSRGVGGGGFQMLPPSGLPMSSATTYSSTTTTCTTNFIHHHPMATFTSDEMFDQSISFPLIKRRGSTSDVELSSTPKYSPVTPRSFKVKSMFMGVNNVDSEDGEVSSGGQEVAEIISKSYENSPIFRKKTWRNQQKQAQANFSKEIWRKCPAQENWSLPQISFERPVQSYAATSKIVEVTRSTNPPPPTTSNLLPILTALSSSNDELNDPKPVRSSTTNIQQKSTFSSSSSSTTDIRNKTEVCVKVPHPDDESFQTFFKNDNANNFLFENFSRIQNNDNADHQNQNFSNFHTGGGGIDAGADYDRSSGISLEEIGAVERQSDLLVMKKNMPVVRRKSSGKSRNPLKALAARMDFRNQKYTEVHLVNDNSAVPNEDQQL